MEADNIIILWVLLWFMQVCKEWLCMFAVAFCEEAVDWNNRPQYLYAWVHVSLSARKLWIEITSWKVRNGFNLSLSARKLWIEICICESGCKSNRSLSARKLWIEIHMRLWTFHSGNGRFLRGSCGLKLLTARHTRTTRHVAFCEEAVDWNSGWLTIVRAWKVAFYEEAVDWNSVVEDIWSILYVHFTKREDSHVFQ